MEEFKNIAIRGDIRAMDEFYELNRRSIGKILHYMLTTNYLEPLIFNIDNTGFIEHMIIKDELFQLLLNNNANIFFHDLRTCNQLREYLLNHPHIMSTIQEDPSKLLDSRMIQCMDINELMNYCELFSHVSDWSNALFDLKIFDEAIIDKYGHIFRKIFIHDQHPCIGILGRTLNASMFEKYFNKMSISTNGLLSFYNIVLSNNTNTQVLEIVLRYRKTSDELYGNLLCNIKTMDINMVKYLYTRRRPIERVFRYNLIAIIRSGRNDIFDYVISIAPYDIDIFMELRLEKNMEMIKSYDKHMPLKHQQENINRLWNEGILSNRLDIIRFLYEKKYHPSIQLDLDIENEVTRWIKKKNSVCCIM